MPATDSQLAHLRLEEPRPQVALLTLDRPKRLNALSWALVDELHAALDAIGRDSSLRALVLTGAGRGFGAGLDLTEARRRFGPVRRAVHRGGPVGSTPRSTWPTRSSPARRSGW